MASLRWLWIGIAVVGCAVAALAGGFRYSLYGRPDPQTASREAIVRWLATSDLAAESITTHDALVDRLTDELRRDATFAAAGDPSDLQRQQLLSNIETLKARWFTTRVDRHAALAGAQRSTYLDVQLATLLAWSQVDAALHVESAPASTGAAAFFADIERWITAERDAARRARMESAVRDGVVRWLATHDLAEQSSDVRRELALVIARGLNEGVDISAVRGMQNSSEQSRLRANGQLLLEAWMLAQAEVYAALPAAERATFIDARIDDATRWNVADLLSNNQTPAPVSPAISMALLGRQIETWIARAEPQQQAQLRVLASDVQARLVQRWLQSLRSN